MFFLFSGSVGMVMNPKAGVIKRSMLNKRTKEITHSTMYYLISIPVLQEAEWSKNYSSDLP